MQSTSNNDADLDEGTKLLLLGLDDLYATLGAQLLGRSPPGKSAGIVSYVSGLRSSFEARELYSALPGGVSMGQLVGELRAIYDGLKIDGKRYLTEVDEDLRRSLCNENIFAAAATQTRSSLAVVTVIVGAALRLPTALDSVAITIGAIILKMGLRNFCARHENDNPS